jgi:surfeit locus 1 family protein
VFMQLGFWQLRRAEQKEQLQSAFERGQQTTLTLTAENIEAVERYQQVRAEGHYLPARQILLDNMPSAQGRPGYRVLTPFVLASGPVLLVDRGWIPMGNRDSLPSLGLEESARTITGRIDQLPRPGLRMGEQRQEADEGWPQVLNFPEQATVEATLEQPVAPHILLLDPANADGFERQWNIHSRFSPDKHIGYAVQWFAFAVCAIVIFLIVSFKPESAARPQA